jgi:hypothetical protein
MQISTRKRAQINTTVRTTKATKSSQSIFFSPTNIVVGTMYEPISAEAKKFPFGLPSDVWIG